MYFLLMLLLYNWCVLLLQLNDGHPMTIFYHCDQAVNHQMEALNHLMRSNPNNLDRYHMNC